jgi:hypothetical protein
LALPPDSTEIFLREVDENLRRDRARDFAKAYGGWIVVAILLFLAASGGFIYWQYYSEQRSEKQVEQLAGLYKDIAAGNTAAVPKQLDDLSNSGSKAVRATALFTRAALALQQNDTNLATAKYREIAGDSSLPQPYRDAALIRQTALEFDSLKPDDIISRLQPLTKPGEPWFGSAGEMTAMAMIKEGRKDEAARLFSAIAHDKSVPDALRERSVQIAGSLGVDASAALRGPAQ